MQFHDFQRTKDEKPDVVLLICGPIVSAKLMFSQGVLQIWNAFEARKLRHTSDQPRTQSEVIGSVAKKTAAHKRPTSDSVRSDRVRGQENCGRT